MRILILIIVIYLFSNCSLEATKSPNHNSVDSIINPTLTTEQYSKLKTRADSALKYCKTKNFNTEYCFLLDMSIHSGLNRFFVWDFKKDTIIKSFLVCHGCGQNQWSSDESKENPTFSNVDGSHCSSLGKYRIGKRSYSNWGINVCYFMHGLEKTNSNALARQIVFHSWNMVSDTEVYPNGSPEGWGCPAISNTNMIYVDSLLKDEEKSVLMWMYR